MAAPRAARRDTSGPRSPNELIRGTSRARSCTATIRPERVVVRFRRRKGAARYPHADSTHESAISAQVAWLNALHMRTGDPEVNSAPVRFHPSQATCRTTRSSFEPTEVKCREVTRKRLATSTSQPAARDDLHTIGTEHIRFTLDWLLPLTAATRRAGLPRQRSYARSTVRASGELVEVVRSRQAKRAFVEACLVAVASAGAAGPVRACDAARAPPGRSTARRARSAWSIANRRERQADRSPPLAAPPAAREPRRQYSSRFTRQGGLR
jgi:hypothetical protein